MNRSLKSLFVLLCLLLSSRGDIPVDTELVPLQNGINEVDFGDGALAGMVLLAHRENFNAHSSEIATFYLRTNAGDADPKQWQIIPFEKDAKSGPRENHLQVGGGADCQTRTFRLLIDRKAKAPFVVTAEREFGKSYSDPNPVTFTWFKLSWNRDGIPGWSRAYFTHFYTQKTKEHYCDVDRALKIELHLDGAMMPKEGSTQ